MVLLKGSLRVTSMYIRQHNTVVFVMFSACVVNESCDGIGLADRLAYSPIPDNVFQAESEEFQILVFQLTRIRLILHRRSVSPTFGDVPQDGRVVHRPRHHEGSLTGPGDVVHVLDVTPTR